MPTLFQNESFLKDEKGSLTVLSKEGDLHATRTILVHIGEASKTTYNDIRHAMGDAIRQLPSTSAGTIGIVFPDTPLDSNRVGQALVEGLVLGNYTYSQFKSKVDTQPLSELTIFTHHDINNAVEHGLISAEATCLARDLANTPANYLTPTLFVEKAKHLLNESCVELSILIVRNEFLSICRKRI